MKRRFLLLALGFIPFFMNAKNDWGAWFEADASWKQNKWVFTGGLEYRMNNNFKDSKRYVATGFAKYRPSQFIRLSGGYEFLLNDDDRQNLDVEHRLVLQLELFFKWNNFKIENRKSLLDNFTSIQHPRWRIRHRVNISYPINRFEPYLAFETYIRLNSKISHQKNRYKAGVSYELSKKHSIDFYYMAEDTPRTPFTYHILGLGYSFTINP